MRVVLKTMAALSTVVGLSLGGVAHHPPTAGAATLDDPFSSAPIVEAGGPDAMPVLLGTALRVNWASSTVDCVRQHSLLVQAASVATVNEPTDTRLLQVVVRFKSLTGRVAIDDADFSMLNANGAEYEPVRPPADQSVPPLLDEELAAGDAVVEGAVYFEVPVRTSGLLIGYDPSPADELVGRWTLSAP